MTNTVESLFGEEFTIKIPQVDTKKIVQKIDNKQRLTADAEKVLKSKKISLRERLAVINSNVLRVLGKQKQNVLVIKDRETFDTYIDNAIKASRIAIDTETNNSLDPITCKLMGLCLYYPGGKQAYIPVNHRNPDTKERLPWQLTEQDCREGLQRVEDAQLFSVFHNYKFDYKVIKCTCDIKVHCDWDTLIASKLIDENEISAGLKQQYIAKIDPTQQKYSIDHLFSNVEYADVNPDIFALYAGTDSMMTDKLYLWQLPIMESYKNEPGPFGKTVYDLFKEVEMPCIVSTAEMELNGILFDTEYAARLRTKFERKLADIDNRLNQELDGYAEKIQAWRETNKAKIRLLKKGRETVELSNGEKYLCELVITSAKTKEKITNITEEAEITFEYCWYKMPEHRRLTEEEVKKKGLRHEPITNKSKAEQLEDPISMSSPTQLAILLYDILGCKSTDKDSPRGTGEEALEKMKLPLTEILLERRGTVKLLDAFINSLPENVNPKTGKIHCSFNQYGAKTGRFSSSEPNLQQIPSHEKSIRLLFRADCPQHQVDITADNYYSIPVEDEVETTQGWKKVKEIQIGDTLIGPDNTDIVKEIKIIDKNYLLYV